MVFSGFKDMHAGGQIELTAKTRLPIEAIRDTLKRRSGEGGEWGSGVGELCVTSNGTIGIQNC